MCVCLHSCAWRSMEPVPQQQKVYGEVWRWLLRLRLFGVQVSHGRLRLSQGQGPVQVRPFSSPLNYKSHIFITEFSNTVWWLSDIFCSLWIQMAQIREKHFLCVWCITAKLTEFLKVEWTLSRSSFVRSWLLSLLFSIFFTSRISVQVTFCTAGTTMPTRTASRDATALAAAGMGATATNTRAPCGRKARWSCTRKAPCSRALRSTAPCCGRSASSSSRLSSWEAPPPSPPTGTSLSLTPSSLTSCWLRPSRLNQTGRWCRNGRYYTLHVRKLNRIYTWNIYQKSQCHFYVKTGPIISL